MRPYLLRKQLGHRQASAITPDSRHVRTAGNAQTANCRDTQNGALYAFALCSGKQQESCKQPADVTEWELQSAEAHEGYASRNGSKGAVAGVGDIEPAHGRAVVKQQDARREYSGGESGYYPAQQRRRRGVFRARREKRRSSGKQSLDHAPYSDVPHLRDKTSCKYYCKTAYSYVTAGESLQQRSDYSAGVYPYSICGCDSRCQRRRSNASCRRSLPPQQTCRRPRLPRKYAARFRFCRPPAENNSLLCHV